MSKQENLITKQIDQWIYKEDSVGAYIKSRLLSNNNFNHAFFTKTSTGKEPENLIKHHKNSSKIFQLRQIHSNIVIYTSKNLSANYPKADGIISSHPNESLWIYSADCIPILFADKRNRTVAACHAGLKGLKSNIIKETIIKMVKIGSKVEDLIVSLGPAISGSKYQVDRKEVIFLKDSLRKSTSSQVSIKANSIIGVEDFSFLKIDNVPNKVLLDIRMLAVHQLIQNGLTIQQLDINKLCTFSSQELFNSWRRDRKKQCQWSFISS